MICLLGYPRALSYDYDWIQAFVDHFDEVQVVNLARANTVQMEDAELVVLLHSATAQGVRIPRWVIEARRTQPRTPWLMLSGNDYKHFQDKQALADELCIDLVATLAPNTPYRTGNGLKQIEHIPHALNPKAFRPQLDYDERPIEIGYRGYRYPDTLGDDERNRLVESFITTDPAWDVSWQVFSHPREYADWLAHCRATIACEAGMPGMKAISSRQFDAIGSGVALIMHPGDYSGCLDERHFIRLEKDQSNRHECLDRIRDPKEWERVVARALAHVMKYHTYEHRMTRVKELLAA